MTKKDKNVEQKLSTLKRQFARELQHRLQECTASSSHDSAELLDMVSDGEYDDLTARIAEADSVKLAQIEEALRMVREGNYGVCQRCGQDIPKRRLKAIPFATLCIDCKEQEERETHTTPVGTSRGHGSAPVEFSLDDTDSGGEELRDVYDEMEKSDIY